MKLKRKAKRIRPGHEPRLALGVRGYTVWSGDALYVPLIMAEEPGNGDVARYLDSLPRDRCVKFPNVLSSKLAQMLVRRGFVFEHEEGPGGEPVELYVRQARR